LGKCWNNNPPWPIEKGKKGHYKHCSKKCLDEYMQCVEETEGKHKSQSVFPSTRDALAWLKRNPEIAIGSRGPEVGRRDLSTRVTGASDNRRRRERTALSPQHGPVERTRRTRG
jgi:hypothetical protein